MTDQNTPQWDMTLDEAANIIEFMLGRGEEADRFCLNNRGVSIWHNVAEGREALEIALYSIKRYQNEPPMDKTDKEICNYACSLQCIRESDA